MKYFAMLLLGLMLLTPIAYADQPYDESANAVSDINQAIKTASAENKHVIAIFGAN
jgi:hypothetical protein